MRETETTNPQLISLIHKLKKESREQQAPIWHDVAEYLSKPRSERITVNLSSINRNTKRSDTVLVPGKLLASGTINHPVTVASFELSEQAKTKLEAAKGKYITIEELLVKNPKGANVRIIR
jgi:large subunit ribosomal protein L18e